MPGCFPRFERVPLACGRFEEGAQLKAMIERGKRMLMGDQPERRQAA
jgi:hypothetical protein